MFHFNQDLLRPRYFFLGILLGFILCSIAGSYVSTKARFHHFSRFFNALSPQMQYYPTMHELLTTAMHDVSPDKILVLIGGNSVFRGAGQDLNQVWSSVLQKQLGDKYKVLNYAMDGATLTAFGGSAFRVLKEKYPKIIFITNLVPGDAGQFDGGDIYNYIFWDAYYKNLYHPTATEAAILKQMRKKQIRTEKGAEQHLLSFLDSHFYFRNLWNWVGYRLSFTVWTEHSVGLAFQPLRRYVDRHDPSFEKIKKELETNPEIFKLGVNLFQDQVSQFVDITHKTLQLRPGVQTEFSHHLSEAFTVAERSHILCVIPSANPFIISALSDESQRAYWFLIAQNRLILKELGYHAIEVGKQFLIDDYADTFHLTASGGEKIAYQIAQEVKSMAILKGYS